MGSTQYVQYNTRLKMRVLRFTIAASVVSSTCAFNSFVPSVTNDRRGPIVAHGFGASRTSMVAEGLPEQGPLRLQDMPGVGPETGGKVWDPLKLASEDSMQQGINLAWYRAAELRHGRTAMLATVGWIATKAGLLFTGLDFVNEVKAVDVWGADQFWNSVPLEYKVAFFLPIFIVEWACETKEPHYTKTNTPGQFPDFVPENIFWPKEPQKFKDMQTKELKNGRLAMIAIVSFLSAEAIPGSVPLYPW